MGKRSKGKGKGKGRRRDITLLELVFLVLVSIILPPLAVAMLFEFKCIKRHDKKQLWEWIINICLEIVHPLAIAHAWYLFWLRWEYGRHK